MSFLLEFSRYYLVSLLSEWLELSDFVCLDTALTNKIHRKKLLNICNTFAKCFETKYFTYDCLSLSMPLGLWLAKRQFSAVCCEMEESFLSVYKPKTVLETIKLWLFGSDAERQCKANPNIIKGIQFHLSVFYNEPKLMSRLLPQCQHLQEIRVYYKETLRSRSEAVHLGYDFDKNITLHASFVNMIRQCHNLRRLQIGTDILTHHLMAALVVWCRKIESVEVSIEALASREQYFLAFHSALHLKQLLIQTATPLLLRTLLWNRGSSLQHLSLVEMSVKYDALTLLPPTLTDLRLCRVSVDGSLIDNLPHLRRLYLHDSNNVPTSIIYGLVNRNMLYSLKLYDASALKSLGLQQKVSLALQELDLTYATDVDDTTLAVLGECCPQLRELTVQFCRKITDKGMYAILVNGKLTSLNMRGSELTSKTLFHLQSYCHGFKYFTLLRSRFISTADLLDFVRHCPSLRYLNVFVDDPKFAKKIREANPKLKWKPY